MSQSKSEIKGLIQGRFGDGLIFTTVDQLINWSRKNSIWFMQFGLACCAIEMMATGASRYDTERFGIMPRGSPRQADLMIVAGTVTLKMATRVKRLYAGFVAGAFGGFAGARDHLTYRLHPDLQHA